MKPTDYIKGNRHGSEAHRIEREAMRDPLLQDALDGFDAVQGDHEEALHRLRQKLPTGIKPEKRQINRNFYRIAVAAALVGVAFMGYRMLWPHENEPETLLAYETETEVISDTVMAPVTVTAPVLPMKTEATATPEQAKTMLVITDNTQIVDSNTEIETTEVFAEFDFDSGFSEAASIGEISDELAAQENAVEAHDNAIIAMAARPKESFTGNARRVSGSQPQGQSAGSVVKSLRNMDPTFYVADSNIMGSDPNSVPIVTMRGTTSLPMMSVQLDSLGAVKAFYDYIAESRHSHKGRIVLEFTTNNNGRPAKIQVVESNATDKSAERRAIRLLRGSPVAWPHRETIRVVIE